MTQTTTTTMTKKKKTKKKTRNKTRKGRMVMKNKKTRMRVTVTTTMEAPAKATDMASKREVKENVGEKQARRNTRSPVNDNHRLEECAHKVEVSRGVRGLGCHASWPQVGGNTDATGHSMEQWGHGATSPQTQGAVGEAWVAVVGVPTGVDGVDGAGAAFVVTVLRVVRWTVVCAGVGVTAKMRTLVLVARRVRMASQSQS